MGCVLSGNLRPFAGLADDHPTLSHFHSLTTPGYLSMTLSRTLSLSTVIPVDWIVIGLIICSVVGIVFGTYAAYKAAHLDPIGSLRYEQRERHRRFAGRIQDSLHNVGADVRRRTL